MKRVLAFLVVLTIACASAVAAEKKHVNAIQPGLFELGLYLGEPTGLSAKYYINRMNAIEGIAAWAFSQGFLVVSADYLFHFPDIAEIEGETFPLFVGAGAIMRVNMGVQPPIELGARIPLGALYVFKGFPLEISLEIVPVLYLFPDTQFTGMGGIGIRYCF
jgi:hypothetical protein